MIRGHVGKDKAEATKGALRAHILEIETKSIQ
jgi:hypothetical protein